MELSIDRVASAPPWPRSASHGRCDQWRDLSARRRVVGGEVSHSHSRALWLLLGQRLYRSPHLLWRCFGFATINHLQQSQPSMSLGIECDCCSASIRSRTAAIQVCYCTGSSPASLASSRCFCLRLGPPFRNPSISLAKRSSSSSRRGRPLGHSRGERRRSENDGGLQNDPPSHNLAGYRSISAHHPVEIDQLVVPVEKLADLQRRDVPQFRTLGPRRGISD